MLFVLFCDFEQYNPNERAIRAILLFKVLSRKWAIYSLYLTFTIYNI